MAAFTTKLLASGVHLASVPPEFQLELVYLLLVTRALAEDQLSAAQPDGLWSGESGAEAHVQEFNDLCSTAVHDVVAGTENWRDCDMAGDSLVERLTNFMLQEARGLSPGAFYTAKALSALFQTLVKVHGSPTGLEEWVARLGIMRVAPDTVLLSAAFLSGFGEALAPLKSVETLCTRLISELPGYSHDHPRTLPSLVLLNLCMPLYEAGRVPVEMRKQVLALQQMTRWMETPEQIGYQLAAETCKAIALMLPGTKDAYGPYWEQAIDYCIWLWNKAAKDKIDERLPYIHASLKLMQALHAADDANDDLVDALASSRKAESAGLVSLLGIPREDTSSVPSQLVDALLARAVSKVPHDHLSDLGDIYESVASESRDIQTAAFGLLHRALPVAQEDINLAVVMDKKGKARSNDKPHSVHSMLMMLQPQISRMSSFPCC